MKTTLSINDERAPMESVSMTRSQFQAYDPIKSKQQYGDPLPSFYIPPTTKFEGSTTSGDTYQGHPGNLLFRKLYLSDFY